MMSARIRRARLVADPVRGAGCIQVRSHRHQSDGVADPVRGAGCIIMVVYCIQVVWVADPVRGAGCILLRSCLLWLGKVADPVRGAGCILWSIAGITSKSIVADPVRGAGCIRIGNLCRVGLPRCRPREGSGLYRQRGEQPPGILKLQTP